MGSLRALSWHRCALIPSPMAHSEIMRSLNECADDTKLSSDTAEGWDATQRDLDKTKKMGPREPHEAQ